MKTIFVLFFLLECVWPAQTSPLTVQAYPVFVQRQLGSGVLCKPVTAGCSAAITVTDAAGPTPVQYGWLDAGGTPIPSFSGASGTTVAGGQTTLNMSGGPFGGGPFTPYVKDMNTGTVYTGSSTVVGDIWFYGGQSNGSGMWLTTSSPPTPYSVTKMLSGTTWGVPTGDGAITFLNELTTCSGVPQAIIAGAIGGTPLTNDGALSAYIAGLLTSLDSWNNTTGAIWSSVTASLNAVNNAVAGIIYHGNESDTLVTNPSVIARGFSKLRRNLAPLITDRDISDIPFAVVELGYYRAWDAQGGSEYAVRKGQHLFVEHAPNAFIGAWQYDMPRDSSNVHLTAAGYAEVGKRLAFSICRKVYFK